MKIFWLFRHASYSLFGLSTVSQAKCASVNGIIQLMESVYLGPKVIPLSGTHFMYQQYLQLAMKALNYNEIFLPKYYFLFYYSLGKLCSLYKWSFCVSAKSIENQIISIL
jgi:hypothetical protein